MKLVKFYDSDGEVDLAVNPEDVVTVYKDDKTGETLVDLRNGDTFILGDSYSVDEAASDIESR